MTRPMSATTDRGPVPADRTACSSRSALRQRATAVGRVVAARLARRGDHGQATAEYGLIILAAGGIALGVIAWASGTGTFTDMFEAVVDKLSESL